MIRLLRPEDIDAVISLWNEAGLLRPWNDPVLDIERKLSQGDDLFLVAELDDTIVGTAMVGYDGHRGWVNYLAVVPDLRARVIGRELMSEAERRLIQLGCPKINLQIRSENRSAISFYQRLGYQVDDVVGMGKRLD